jgi:hypothetical protein
VNARGLIRFRLCLSHSAGRLPTHGKPLSKSSCNDTIDRLSEDPAIFGWKFQPGITFRKISGEGLR